MPNPNCFPKECFSIFKSSTSKPCPKGSNCIRLGTITVNPKDSVECSESGFTPFDCFDFSACQTDVEFIIVDSENLDFLESYTIDQTGFAFTRTDSWVNKISLTFKACCEDGEGCRICDFGCITIYFPNNCFDVPEGCTCNPCNGTYICTDGSTFNHQDGPDFPTETTVGGKPCTDPITYQILNYDDRYFTNVTIDSNGSINYDLVCSELLKVGFTSEIEYSASTCGATDISIERIVFEPLCNTVTCEENFKCNYCTGICEEIPCETPTTTTEGNLEDSQPGAADCNAPKSEVTYSPQPKKPYSTTSQKDICYTDLTQPEPPTDEELCELALEPFKGACILNCLECEVIDGKACVTQIEEVFPIEQLQEVCVNETIELTGSCCTVREFQGLKVETWEQNDTICLGDPYTVIGTCGTPQEFIGTQIEDWDCGDTSQYCGVYTVISNCGNQIQCQGTKLDEVLEPLKPEVLAAVCQGTFIPCPSTCGTIMVEGTMDCSPVDLCIGVTCPETTSVDSDCENGIVTRTITDYDCVDGNCIPDVSTLTFSCDDPCLNVTCPDTEIIDGACTNNEFTRTTTVYICFNGVCTPTTTTEILPCCSDPDTDWEPILDPSTYCIGTFETQTRRVNCQIESREVEGTQTGFECQECDVTITDIQFGGCNGDGTYDFTISWTSSNVVEVAITQLGLTGLPPTFNNYSVTGYINTLDPTNLTMTVEGTYIDNVSKCGDTVSTTVEDCSLCEPDCSGPQCGQSDGCGDICPNTDDNCPDLSTVPCQTVYENLCGTNCGTGTGLNVNQCEDPSTVPCNQQITDNCGNSCGTVGTMGCTDPCDPINPPSGIPNVSNSNCTGN